jgi:hypothetical protein
MINSRDNNVTNLIQTTLDQFAGLLAPPGASPFPPLLRTIRDTVYGNTNAGKLAAGRGSQPINVDADDDDDGGSDDGATDNHPKDTGVCTIDDNDDDVDDDDDDDVPVIDIAQRRMAGGGSGGGGGAAGLRGLGQSRLLGNGVRLPGKSPRKPGLTIRARPGTLPPGIAKQLSIRGLLTGKAGKIKDGKNDDDDDDSEDDDDDNDDDDNDDDDDDDDDENADKQPLMGTGEVQLGAPISASMAARAAKATTTFVAKGHASSSSPARASGPRIAIRPKGSPKDKSRQSTLSMAFGKSSVPAKRPVVVIDLGADEDNNDSSSGKCNNSGGKCINSSSGGKCNNSSGKSNDQDGADPAGGLSFEASDEPRDGAEPVETVPAVGERVGPQPEKLPEELPIDSALTAAAQQSDSVLIRSLLAENTRLRKENRELRVRIANQ